MKNVVINFSLNAKFISDQNSNYEVKTLPDP